MKIDVDVLRALMFNGVVGHVDDTDVVTEDHCSTAEGSMELKYKLPEPCDLSHSVGNGAVLSFGTGAGDSHLSLG